MEGTSYKYYGNIETISTDSIVVSPTNELIQVQTALDQGIEFIRGGGFPYIPLIALNNTGMN